MKALPRPSASPSSPFLDHPASTRRSAGHTLDALLLLAAFLGAVPAGCRDRQAPVPPPSYAPSTPVPAGGAQTAPSVEIPPQPGQRTDLVLSEDAKHALLRFARLVCNGQGEEAGRLALPAELATVDAPVIAMVFDADGTRRGKRRIDDPGVPLADKLARSIPELCGSDPQGYLHLLVISYKARLPNFGIKGIFDNRVYEAQVTGVAYEVEGRRVEIDPVEALQLNLGPKGTRNVLSRRLGIEPRKLTERNDLTMEFYRVLHFGETWPDRGFANFHRGHVVLTADQVTHELLQQRLALIGDWYRHNVRDGEVAYEYSVQSDRENDKPRTMVRSTMATWVLNRLAEYLGDEELKRLGAQVIDHYLERYFQMSRSLAAGQVIPSDQPLPSGDRVKNRYTAASFIAAAILERADRGRWQKEPGLLMRWAMSYVRNDGLMWTQWSMNQYFDPGQLLLSVALHYEQTRDETYRRFFEKVFGAYEGPLRDMMHLGNERYIPYAPAWFTQPAALMYLTTGENRYRDLVYAINDRVVKLYPLNTRDQVYYDYDGALAPKPSGGFGNTSVTAAALESLVDAAIVARRDGDTARARAYAEVIRHTVAFLLRLQYVPANTYHMRNRERAIGGFKRDMIDTTLWMDNVWHLTSAFIKIQRHRLLEPPSAAPAAANGSAPTPATAP